MSAARPDTWMPFYVGDYLRDTQHLDAEKHGAYFLLILCYWVSGRPLPDDDEHLAAVARMTLKRWKQIRPVIERFFQIDGGEWCHGRVEEELANATAIVSAKSTGGKRGAKTRWDRHRKANGKPMAMPSTEPMTKPRDIQCQNDAPSQSPLSAPNGAGGKPPPDAVKVMFDSAIQIFQEAGKRPDEARSITGKLRKFLGDQKAADTVKAAHGKSDPAAYLMRILTDETGKRDRLASEVAPL